MSDTVQPPDYGFAVADNTLQLTIGTRRRSLLAHRVGVQAYPESQRVHVHLVSDNRARVIANLTTHQARLLAQALISAADATGGQA